MFKKHIATNSIDSNYLKGVFRVTRSKRSASDVVKIALEFRWKYVYVLDKNKIKLIWENPYES